MQLQLQRDWAGLSSVLRRGYWMVSLRGWSVKWCLEKAAAARLIELSIRPAGLQYDPACQGEPEGWA